MRTLLFFCLFLLSLTATAGAKTSVAISLFSATDKFAKERELVEEIMQAELSASEDISIVDRNNIKDALKEIQMGEQGMLSPDTAGKIGKIVGAKYFCAGKISESGKNGMIIVKIIDVETTVAKLAYSQLKEGGDAVETGKALAQNIRKLVAQFEEQKKKDAKSDAQAAAAKAIPAEWKRPVVMVIIPEMHITRPVIDPAAETELVKRLLKENFKVVDSEHVKMAKSSPEQAKELFKTIASSSDYAKGKGVDILIYGEAISEESARLGEFEGCRARVELKAIKTSTGEIILSDSGYAGATDLSGAVAGKKAIQQAADKLADTFVYSLAEKWNKSK